MLISRIFNVLITSNPPTGCVNNILSDASNKSSDKPTNQKTKTATRLWTLWGVQQINRRIFSSGVGGKPKQRIHHKRCFHCGRTVQWWSTHADNSEPVWSGEEVKDNRLCLNVKQLWGDEYNRKQSWDADQWRARSSRPPCSDFIKSIGGVKSKSRFNEPLFESTAR